MLSEDQAKGSAIHEKRQLASAFQALDRGKAPADSGREGPDWRQFTAGVGRDQSLAIP